MKKKYTIEVPVNSSPLSRLIELDRQDDFHIVVYGGIPDSPLNGGRNNFLLDREKFLGRLFFGINKIQLTAAFQRFYANIEKTNAGGIPFYLALTNMFVTKDELIEENLRPIDRLVESGRKHGVKNGLIIYSKLLENNLRQKYGGELAYVSSCTKYSVADRILSPRDTLKMYKEDLLNYDYIVLTPQDSRREKVIREALKDNPAKVICICNSYCANNCNCYQHYELFSRENKRSLLKIKSGYILISGILFMLKHLTVCPVVRPPFQKIDFRPIAQMQLAAGVVYFKLGRGIGDDFLEQLVLMIKESRNSRTLLQESLPT